MGWTGGRYTTSKPMAATASSRSAAVRSVPLTGGFPARTTAPSERGNSSYQDPNSARLRSTWSARGREEETSSRSGWRSRTAVTSGLRAAASRAATGRAASRSASAASSTTALPSRLGTRAAARSCSTAPSSRVSSVSIPAGILIFACSRQVLMGSLQASTEYVQRPSASGVTSAPQRSVPGASSRIGVHGPARPAGPRSTTFAPRLSWPSLKTVAETWKVSPVTALAGRVPHSTSGWTSSTGMRPIMGSPGGIAGDDGMSVLCIRSADGFRAVGVTLPARVHPGGGSVAALSVRRYGKEPVPQGAWRGLAQGRGVRADRMATRDGTHSGAGGRGAGTPRPPARLDAGTGQVTRAGPDRSGHS